MILAELLSALRGPVPYSDTEVRTPGVSSDERFGEHDQLGTVGRGLSDQPLRLVESGGSVVEDGGGLDDGSADGDGGRGVGHHVDLREKWAIAAAVADWVGRNERHSWVRSWNQIFFCGSNRFVGLASALSELTAEFEDQTEGDLCCLCYLKAETGVQLTIPAQVLLETSRLKSFYFGKYTVIFFH